MSDSPGLQHDRLTAPALRRLGAMVRELDLLVDSPRMRASVAFSVAPSSSKSPWVVDAPLQAVPSATAFGESTHLLWAIALGQRIHEPLHAEQRHSVAAAEPRLAQ